MGKLIKAFIVFWLVLIALFVIFIPINLGILFWFYVPLELLWMKALIVIASLGWFVAEIEFYFLMSILTVWKNVFRDTMEDEKAQDAKRRSGVDYHYSGNPDGSKTSFVEEGH